LGDFAGDIFWTGYLLPKLLLIRFFCLTTKIINKLAYLSPFI